MLYGSSWLLLSLPSSCQEYSRAKQGEPQTTNADSFSTSMPVMFEALPERCVTVAKKEILYMGTFGLCCWLSKFIFIDRRKTDRAISVMSKVARTMHQEDVSGTRD